MIADTHYKTALNIDKTLSILSKIKDINSVDQDTLNNLTKDLRTLERAIYSQNITVKKNKKNEPVDIWNIKADSVSNKVDVIFCKHKDYEKVTTNITKSPINKDSRKFKKYLKVREVLIFNDRTKCPRSYKNISYIEVKASPIFQNQHNKFCYNTNTKIVYSQRKKTNDYLSVYEIQDILKKWKYLDNSSLYGYNGCRERNFNSYYGPIKYASYNNGINVFVRDNINTEIAKAEPSQKENSNFNREDFFRRLSKFERSIKELTNKNEEFVFKKANSWGVNSVQCNASRSFIISKIEEIKNQIKYFEEISIPNDLTKSSLKINDLKNVFENLNKVLSCDKVLVVEEKDQEFSNLGVGDQYNFARKFLQIGEYDNAEIYFRKFVVNHPDHVLASKAQYWLAETFRIRQLWTDAAQEYLVGYQKYPNSDIGPENLLKLGVSLVEIGEKDQGCLMMAGVQKQYPKAPASVLYKANFYLQNQYQCEQKIVIVNKDKKKKIEVAKVEEPKQEEFKPKTKDIDNDAPIIEIAEALTVDSQAYTLKGKVKDESRFFLTIDDRPIKVAKNGKFEFEGFAIETKEQLKIVAIDRWKNKSEKIINIEVKIKEVADLRLYEKPNPGKIKVRKDNNKIGIIIGIEKYQNLDNIDAPYANRDANAFKAYANLALGIPNKNLKVLIDDKATRGELLKSLKIWLPQITRGQKKDIYIFFAGHGLASDDGEDLHILPHNGDPILLEDTAISRVEMFDLINKVNPKSVTMFFDTCYSGQTRSEQMLVAGLRPVRIIADEQDTPNNFTIFTASNYDQTSGSISEAEHGIFSYYLMKGLEGNADENKDKKITNGELIAYLKNNVSQEAFSQNRSQEPMLAGDPNNILLSYR